MDLSYKNLYAIDDSVFILSHLTELDASNNYLENLPEGIAYCFNLKILNIRRNNLNKIPEFISKLKYLEELYLGGNSISEIPENITELKNLKKLYIPNNKLDNLPEFIGNLEHLEELVLSGNKITKLPDSIGKLKNLKKLDLFLNKLIKLPDSFIQLTNLEELNLWNNEFDEIPEITSKMPSLKNIDININQKQLNKMLIEAVRDDDVSTCEHYIKMGADVNYKCEDSPGYNLTTPLFEAKSVDMIKLLLDNNADVNIKREKRGEVSIKVWESDKSSGETETFLSKAHKPEIKEYLKKINLI
ncbi:MAG: hypothetical protein Kow0068_12000 [Marinilabiliales bacterium]